jgi:hypothetical protein
MTEWNSQDNEELDEDTSGDEDGEDDEENAHNAEIGKITKPIFEDPLRLINLDANIDEFLAAKRISDVMSCFKVLSAIT